MSLKPLINNQSLIIDDHKWGAREEKNWDRKSIDIHIDKKTKYPIKGKKQEVRIKIPINTEREISIVAKNKKIKEIPSKLIREIKKALEDKPKREAFVRDLIPILENFNSILSSIEKAREVLDRIVKHFDLKWTGQEIENILKEALIEYIRIYEDESGTQYYIELDNRKIKISNVDHWIRSKYKIQKTNNYP